MKYLMVLMTACATPHYQHVKCKVGNTTVAEMYVYKASDGSYIDQYGYPMNIDPELCNITQTK